MHSFKKVWICFYPCQVEVMFKPDMENIDPIVYSVKWIPNNQKSVYLTKSYLPMSNHCHLLWNYKNQL